MICEQERNKLLVAKKLYQDGTISQDILFKTAEEYRSALLECRKGGVKVGGKPLWVPRTLHRLVCITYPFPGEVVE